MALPLTKTLDPERDYTELAPELVLVDQYFTTAREQHPHRRFEYAMALRALTTWRDGKDYRAPNTVADVGGAGSPFARILYATESCPIVSVIDPDEPLIGTTLAAHLTNWLSTCTLEPCVFCLSVVEHVEDLDQFLYHLSCLVAPGGLLFLTVDCREDAEPRPHYAFADDRHFHWMRKRLFTPYLLQYRVYAPLKPLGFEFLGTVDWTYHGPHVYDYTFASLALVKRL